MDERPHITVSVDGVKYSLFPQELSARDTTDVRRATGMSFRFLMEAAGKDPDLDVVAAVVWLARRQAGESVTFDEVANAIGYDANIENVTDPVEPEPDSPEA
jgi:hypothetical protein